MATTVEVPSNLTEARETVSNLASALDRMRAESRAKNGRIAQLEDAVVAVSGRAQELISRAPAMVKPGVEIGVTMTAAYAGAYADEWLRESKSDKVGPAPLVPLVGGVMAVGSLLFVKDPDIQAAGIATGTGLAAVAVVDAGRKMRKTHKTALDEMAAKKAAEAAKAPAKAA